MERGVITTRDGLSRVGTTFQLGMQPVYIRSDTIRYDTGIYTVQLPKLYEAVQARDFNHSIDYLYEYCSPAP